MAESLTGIYDQVRYALTTQTRALSILQEQAATGSRVNRPSDDPMAARDILAMNSQNRSLANYSKTLDNVIGSLETCNTAIETMTANLSEARQLMTQAIGGIMSPDQQTITAGQINEIIEQMAALANTQSMGSYVFAGSDSASPAYTVERSGGKITAVNYSGSMETREVDVAPGVIASGVMVGKTAFGGSDTAEPLFPDAGTGVSAGAGTSTVNGVLWLNVAVEGSGYKLSIDGGLTYVTADGSTNQALTDSRTGKVLYVNTSAITGAGTDLVRISGQSDVFSTLIAVRDALLSGNSAKISQLQKNADTIFQESQQSIVKSATWTGAKINGLSSLKDSMEKIATGFTDRTALLQDADIAQVAIDLSRHQLLYQMSMQVASKALSTSLLDFIGTV
jgi:flagellar hook-associated protein 3 FlgL